MKCTNCGREIANDSVFCEFCGSKVQKQQPPVKKENNTALWVTLGIIGFLIVGGIFVSIIMNYSSNNYSSIDDNGYYSGDNYIIDETYQENSGATTEDDYSYNQNSTETQTTTYNNSNSYTSKCIYSLPGEFYCDGIYQYNETGHGLNISVPYLKRNKFRITLSFMPLSYKGNLDWRDYQNLIMLGHSYRDLSISLKSNKQIYITKNNNDDFYDTGIPYAINEYNYIDFIFDNGEVSINGKILHIGTIEEHPYDNEISSLDYSNGSAFKGYIKDVYIYNLE